MWGEFSHGGDCSWKAFRGGAAGWISVLFEMDMKTNEKDEGEAQGGGRIRPGIFLLKFHSAARGIFLREGNQSLRLSETYSLIQAF